MNRIETEPSAAIRQALDAVRKCEKDEKIDKDTEMKFKLRYVVGRHSEDSFDYYYGDETCEGETGIIPVWGKDIDKAYDFETRNNAECFVKVQQAYLEFSIFEDRPKKIDTDKEEDNLHVLEIKPAEIEIHFVPNNEDIYKSRYVLRRKYLDEGFVYFAGHGYGEKSNRWVWDIALAYKYASLGLAKHILDRINKDNKAGIEAAIPSITPEPVKDDDDTIQTVTLRDEIAMLALQGMIAARGGSNMDGLLPDYAKFAYEMADIMLDERAGNEDKG